MYDLKDLLQRSIEENASDVHFTVGKPPCYRIDGVLSAIEGERLMPDTLKELLLPIMEERHKEELKRDGQTDFAYAIAGVGRTLAAECREARRRIFSWVFSCQCFSAERHAGIRYAMPSV